MDPTAIKLYSNAIKHLAYYGTPGTSRGELLEKPDIVMISVVFTVPQLTVAKDVIAVRAGEVLELFEQPQAYHGRSKAGRCRSGGDATGEVVHALPASEDGYGFTAALCGTQPTGHSAGWGSEPHPARHVTCEKCCREMQLQK